MSRNYKVMLDVLDRAARARPSRRVYEFDDFSDIDQRDRVREELLRLKRDGLVDGAASFDASGFCLTCSVAGLTDEGEEFHRLVENDGVREVALSTLRDADADVPYPLLKEVCEEIVKRYVTSFIPKM